MTIQDLIRILRTYPTDMCVVVNGYEEGYDDLSPKQISTAKITLNTGRHRWEGRHGDLSDLSGRPQDDAEIVDALVLRRASH